MSYYSVLLKNIRRYSSSLEWNEKAIVNFATEEDSSKFDEEKLSVAEIEKKWRNGL